MPDWKLKSLKFDIYELIAQLMIRRDCHLKLTSRHKAMNTRENSTFRKHLLHTAAGQKVTDFITRRNFSIG